MHHTLMLQVAYTLLGCAFCSSTAATVALHDDEDSSYPLVSGLLFAALLANLCRTLLSPVNTNDPIALFEYRALFLVWPMGVLFLLLHVFKKGRSAGAVISLSGLLVMALGVCPDWFDGGITGKLVQVIGLVSITCALGLLINARKRRPIRLAPEEISVCFCAVAEGIVAAVGHLLPGTWWPALAIYCALYIALILHHARILWTARQTLPASLPT